MGGKREREAAEKGKRREKGSGGKREVVGKGKRQKKHPLVQEKEK